MSTLSESQTGPTPAELMQKLRTLKLSQMRKQLEEDYEKWGINPPTRYQWIVSFIRLCETQEP